MKFSNPILPRFLGLAAAAVLVASQIPVFAQTAGAAPAQNQNQNQNTSQNKTANQNQTTNPCESANRMEAPAEAMHARMEKRFNSIASLLDLNPDQRTKAQAIFQDAWNRAQPLLPQLKQNRDEIAKLAESPTPPSTFNTDIVKYSEREGNLVSQLVTIRSEAMQKFRAMLNPAQQQKAADLYTLMTTRMPFRFEMSPVPGHPAMTQSINQPAASAEANRSK